MDTTTEGEAVSATELRRAAETLRDLASEVKERSDEWWSTRALDGLDPYGVLGGDGPYIATMSPGVGLALAEALDHCARHWWDYNSPHLLDVARLING